jgi:hypothetical protein
LENFSETKKGGRPRVIHPAMRKVIDFAVGRPSATERTRQNKHYQIHAMQTLGLKAEDDTPAAYLWIWGKPHVPRPGDHKVKWTVLGELGRVEDAELMREMAARVCELKLSTRDAVAAIRRLRSDGNPPGSALDLANAVIKTINDYMNAHDGLTSEDIRAALQTVAGNIIE